MPFAVYKFTMPVPSAMDAINKATGGFHGEPVTGAALKGIGLFLPKILDDSSPWDWMIG